MQCNCRRAMAQDAKLILIERLSTPANGDAEAMLSDLNTLVVAEGASARKLGSNICLDKRGWSCGQ